MARPLLADEWNQGTEFQFSAPVQIPRKTLEAGKYLFELADAGSNPNVVRIFSEDSGGKDNLAATLMVIPVYREQTADKPVVTFEERPSGTPEAIHSWFYPGEHSGLEFLYSNTHTPEAE